MYGVLRPYDEIRPYRLEMSTKLSVGDAPNLYQFWGDSLTDSINAESPDWVLNVASAEYSKSIKMKSVTAPVITASFPGPAVYAKQARGEITRFCCERKVTKPEELLRIHRRQWSVGVCGGRQRRDESRLQARCERARRSLQRRRRRARRRRSRRRRAPRAVARSEDELIGLIAGTRGPIKICDCDAASRALHRRGLARDRPQAAHDRFHTPRRASCSIVVGGESSVR